MSDLTKIKIYGPLADRMGKSEWNLKVGSVMEAMFAINILTKDKLRITLTEEEKKNNDYLIVVDGEYIEDKAEIEISKDNGIKLIEMMPVIEGKLDPATWAYIAKLVIMAILSALISYGISKLMQAKKSETPETNPSYLMDGIQNLAKQGLPVPLGYGRMLVGSLVVSQSIRYIDIDYKTLNTNT